MNYLDKLSAQISVLSKIQNPTSVPVMSWEPTEYTTFQADLTDNDLYYGAIPINKIIPLNLRVMPNPHKERIVYGDTFLIEIQQGIYLASHTDNSESWAAEQLIKFSSWLEVEQNKSENSEYKCVNIY